jgi:transglutaminase-like putative cysteine protease
VESEIEKISRSVLRATDTVAIPWEQVREKLGADNELYLDALQYIPQTPMTISTPGMKEYALVSFTPGKSMFAATHDLMRRIYQDFEFKPGFTTISTPLSEVMQMRRGVCQDFAHLAIACIRSLGLPARYVSGYLETLPPPGMKKLSGVDASHAWFAVFVPGMGWVDFDPTNNHIPGDQHLVIGWGRDYADIAPLTGVLFSSGQHRLSVSVDVRRG